MSQSQDRLILIINRHISCIAGRLNISVYIHVAYIYRVYYLYVCKVYLVGVAYMYYNVDYYRDNYHCGWASDARAWARRLVKLWRSDPWPPRLATNGLLNSPPDTLNVVWFAPSTRTQLSSMDNYIYFCTSNDYRSQQLPLFVVVLNINNSLGCYEKSPLCDTTSPVLSLSRHQILLLSLTVPERPQVVTPNHRGRDKFGSLYDSGRMVAFLSVTRQICWQDLSG